MGGGDEGRGDGFTNQVLGVVDATAVAHHQGFRSVDLCRYDKRHNRQVARGRRRERAGAEVADLYITGSDGRDYLWPAVEAAPGDFFADGFFVQAVGLGNLAGIDAGLVAHRQVGGVDTKRK